jgi:protein gp37
MADRTGIEWTDATWSPVTGCTPVSAGCDHCYAETLSRRLQRMGVVKYRNGFEVTLHPEALSLPISWKRPRRIFVNSMSDLFHARVPFAFVERVWEVMLRADQHTYQILTKRPERMARWTAQHLAPPHIWLGTSVEDLHVVSRIDRLRDCRAAVRFLSCEPLIGPLPDLDLTSIHWVIAGGESGPGYRPVDPDWVRDVRDQCLRAGIPFFFKQWGGRTPGAGGRLLDGRTWDEFPVSRPMPPLLRLVERDLIFAL